MIYISVLKSLFSNLPADPIWITFTMILFSSGFPCIVVILVFYCPVRSGENEVTTINEGLNEDTFKGFQDEDEYIQTGNLSDNPLYRNSISVRVVNGNKTGIKSHPYLAAFTMDNGEIYCGGTIISSDFIMTAAHCLAYKKTGKLKPIHDRSVYLGVHNRFSERNNQGFRIILAIVHENFSNTGFDGFSHHDIGLVKVNPQIHYNPFIQRICLTDNDMNVITSRYIGAIQGWGLVFPTNGIHPIHVLKTALTIVSGDECSKYKDNLPDHNTVVCGIDYDNPYVSGACKGDSGGPFFIMNRGQKVQIGIISFSTNCSVNQSPDVYMRVSYFLPWIFSHVPRSSVCVVDT